MDNINLLGFDETPVAACVRYFSDIAYSQFFYAETTARMAYLKNVGTLQTPNFTEVRP